MSPWFEPLAPCPAVVLRDVRLRAGSRVLVDGLSLSIHPGQLWCIVGPNGVGKSTLMGVLAGLRAPDGGAVEIDGVAPRRWRRPRWPASAPTCRKPCMTPFRWLSRMRCASAAIRT
jgi:ABC-type multidrug transport system fused ATPase/permease subunit